MDKDRFCEWLEGMIKTSARLRDEAERSNDPILEKHYESVLCTLDLVLYEVKTKY